MVHSDSFSALQIPVDDLRTVDSHIKEVEKDAERLQTFDLS